MYPGPATHHLNCARRGGALVLLVLLAASPGLAANAPADDDAEELEEIIVEGSSLWKLREQMRETEERFFARYNELNHDNDFDIHCRMNAPLGTRLQKRECRLAFHLKARTEATQARLAGGDAPDPDLVLLERWSEYRANALAVINGDRELLRLVREREKLEQRYEAQRKDYLKGRLVRW